MSMKRWHHKSRSGCVQCRQRRIKCGEERPHCRNCVRAETADSCTYRQPESGQSRSNASTPAAEVAPRLLSTPGAPVPFTVSELELMHHYCTSTSSAVEDEPTVASWMRNVAPTLLISHPTLIGGLLGLTAAHIAFLRPYDKQRYTGLAYQHLNHALTQSQQALKHLDSSIDAEKAGALCLTAIFTSITIQALPVVDSNQQHMTALQRFITNFRAFRGISVVFWACSIHGNGFDQNYLPPTGGDRLGIGDQESYEMIDELYMIIKKQGEESKDQSDMRRHSMYCAIFDELRNYVRAKTIRQVSTVITGSTPAQWNMFCRLLDEGDVVCSLIGLCYNVAYSSFDQKWFMGGLQHEVAKVLSARVQHVGEPEARIAEWARRRYRQYDAVADRAGQIRATSINTATSTTSISHLPNERSADTFEIANAGDGQAYEFHTAETSVSSDCFASAGPGPRSIADADGSIMEGLEAGIRLCSSAVEPRLR